jgi:hypothetical protein
MFGMHTCQYYSCSIIALILIASTQERLWLDTASTVSLQYALALDIIVLQTVCFLEPDNPPLAFTLNKSMCKVKS